MPSDLTRARARARARAQRSGARNRNRMEAVLMFDHDKLDVYRLAIE